MALVLAGPIFQYSTGNILLLYVSHPGLVKEISLHKSLDLGKPRYMQKERRPLFGNGILTSNGPLWAHQRKIIGPELFMDKVKVNYTDTEIWLVLCNTPRSFYVGLFLIEYLGIQKFAKLTVTFFILFYFNGMSIKAV